MVSRPPRPAKAASASWPTASPPATSSAARRPAIITPASATGMAISSSRLVTPFAGQYRGQRVVDDLRGGVHQVQQVAEDPQPGLDQGDAPAGRRLDVGVQATGPAHPPCVAQPDQQREREQRHRGDHGQPGRGAARRPRWPARISAARASGPPNDTTARAVKAHPLTGRPDSSGGRSAPVPVIRARNVVTATLSPSYCRSWSHPTKNRQRPSYRTTRKNWTLCPPR